MGKSHGHLVPLQGKLFLGSVVLNVLIILAYRFAVLISLISGSQNRSDPKYNTDHIWFFCLNLETAGFMGYFAMDSVLTENHYELLAFVVCAFFLGLRSVLEYFSQDPEAGDLCVDETGLGGFCVASVVVQCVFTVLYLIFAPAVWRSYGWRFYKVVGSDAKLQSMWLHYQQFLSLKFLDLSFSLLVMTTGVIYLAFTVYGSIISVIYVFIELFWMRLGTVGIEKENDGAMKGWIILSLLSPLYILFFGLIAQQTGGTSSTEGESNGTVVANETVTGMSSAAAIENPIIVGKMIVLFSLALINRIATIYWGYRGWLMFGKGMLDRVFPRMLPGAGLHVVAKRSNNGARVVVNDSHPKPSEHSRGISVFNDPGAQNVSNKL